MGEVVTVAFPYINFVHIIVEGSENRLKGCLWNQQKTTISIMKQGNDWL